MVMLFCNLLALAVALVPSSIHLDDVGDYDVVRVDESHNPQLLEMFDTTEGYYPAFTELKFDAFGKHYVVYLEKNTAMIVDDLLVQTYNKSGMFTHTLQKDKDHCQYHGECTNCDGPSLVVASLCAGRGMHAMITANDQTISIKPLAHMDPTREFAALHARARRRGGFGRKSEHLWHSVLDDHVAYHFTAVNRRMDPSSHFCGTDHPLTMELTKLAGRKVPTYLDNGPDGIVDMHEHQHTGPKKAMGERIMEYATMPMMSWQEMKEAKERRRNAETKYVELLVVTDPAFNHKWGGTENDPNERAKNIEAAIMDISNVVTTYYANSNFAYNVQVVLTAVTKFDGTWASMSVPNSNTGADLSAQDSCAYDDGHTCSVNYDDFLNKFHQWRRSDDAPAHDNAHMFSYMDFLNSVIGYANMKAMCSTYSSGGINQMTFDAEYNAGIVSHEMGHNFNMRHDSDQNACSGTGYIMAASGNVNGFRPKTFSSCSQNYIDTYFSSNAGQLVCLSNEPQSTFAKCGNGVIETGESCDCGGGDCSSIDPCCDGTLCALRSGYACSNSQPCCQNCQVVALSDNLVCRDKSADNSCDIQAEVCNGETAECPYDTFHNEGTACTVTYDSSGYIGYCYDGFCKSVINQCQDMASDTTYQSYGPFTTCGVEGSEYTASAASDFCSKLCCKSIPFSAEMYFPTSDPTSPGSNRVRDNGMPCYKGTSQPAQCTTSGASTTCEYSSGLTTHKWFTAPWQDCSLPCIDATDLIKGERTRNVFCGTQDGNSVADSICENLDLTEPQDTEYCNAFYCEPCRDAVLCGVHGVCDEFNENPDQVECDCIHGYSSSDEDNNKFCDLPPSITWQAISGIFRTINGVDEFFRAPTPDGGSGSSWTAGIEYFPTDTISARWNSSGTIDKVIVGFECKGACYWGPAGTTIYAETSEVTDQNSGACINDTAWALPTCEDFQWTIPREASAGEYRLKIIFNSQTVTYSDYFNISCNSINCGDYGSCGTNGACECTDNYFGPTCEDTPDKPWEFLDYSTDIQGVAANKPRCHDGTYDFAGLMAVNNSNIGKYPSEECICPLPFYGQYCEWNGTEVLNCAGMSAETEPEFCKNGGVRVPIDDTAPFCWSSDNAVDNWKCDCQGDNSNWQYNSATKNCDTCLLTCVSGVPDDECTHCTACDENMHGTTCANLYWIGEVVLDIPPTDILNYGELVTEDNPFGANKTANFEAALLTDLAFILNYRKSKLDIYDLVPEGEKMRVYFLVELETADSKSAQNIWGDKFALFDTLHEDVLSSAYRGIEMGSLDASEAINWCLPYYELCEPPAGMSLDMLFYISLGVSFGLVLLYAIIHRICTRKRRLKSFQKKVEDIKNFMIRQHKLHEQMGGGVNRRQGLRRVSKGRARKIYKAKVKAEKHVKKVEKKNAKENAKQAKRQSKLDKKTAKLNKKDAKRQSKLEKKAAKGRKSAAGQGEGEPDYVEDDEIAALASEDYSTNLPLPEGWHQFASSNGVPYWWNERTGVSTWAHPAENQEYSNVGKTVKRGKGKMSDLERSRKKRQQHKQKHLVGVSKKRRDPGIEMQPGGRHSQGSYAGRSSYNQQYSHHPQMSPPSNHPSRDL